MTETFEPVRNSSIIFITQIYLIIFIGNADLNIYDARWNLGNTVYIKEDFFPLQILYMY